MKLDTFLGAVTHYSNVDTLRSSPDRSASKPEDYIEVLTENKYKAVAFTENNNVFNWSQKKQMVEDVGMKYIHAVRANVVSRLNKTSTIHHLVLVAKNYEGVKEINKMIGLSFQGRNNKEYQEGDHFYYQPRLSFDEIESLSDNVILIFGGLNNPLWVNYRSNLSQEEELWKSLLKREHTFVGFTNNSSKNQYLFMNKYIKSLNLDDKSLILYNETYSHHAEFEYLRYLLNKKEYSGYELDGNASFQYDDDIIDGLSKSFTQEEMKNIINNTNNISNLVEDFEMDMTFKYPKLYSEPDKEIRRLIKQGYEERGLNELSEDKQQIYKDQIEHELSTMTKVNAINFMLLQQYLSREMREKKGYYTGPGRGSAGASLVSYLLRITDVDPIEDDLIFERFMNESRISLGDIDIDVNPDERFEFQKLLLEHPDLHCASIITFGTLGIKGAVRDIGKAMDYTTNEINSLANAITEHGKHYSIPNSYKDKYSLLIQYCEKLLGVITHSSRHAGAILASDRDIDGEIGTVMVKGFDYPVTAWSMDEVERNLYVKLDILGLINLKWIHEATRLAEIPRLHLQADHIDYDDWSIRDDLLKYGTATIFQLEIQEDAIQTAFKDESIARMRKLNPDIRIVDILSMITAAIRPGASSVKEEALNGIAHDHGVPEINEILKDTFGHLLYQEQTIALIQYAGFSASEADVIRRAIGHKTPKIINEWIPNFKETLVDKIMTDYPEKDVDEVRESVDGLAQIIIDSSDYSFNKAHSYEYSYISIETAWLRTHYPLEWITSGYTVWDGQLSKVNTLNRLAKEKGINIERAKFRRSRGDYFFDRETNTIYEGTQPIKGMNGDVGNWLYDEFKDKEYDYFTDFLMDATDPFEVVMGDNNPLDKNTLSWHEVLNLDEDTVKEIDKTLKSKDDSVKVTEMVSNKEVLTPNSGQMLALIRLGYFSEFGGSFYLQSVYEKYRDKYNKGNKTLNSKRKNYQLVLDYEKSLDKDSDLSIYDRANYELHYLEKCVIKDERIPKQYAVVTNVMNRSGNHVKVDVHSINQGQSVMAKIPMKMYNTVSCKVGDVIEILDTNISPRPELIDGKWGKSRTKKDLWLNSIKYIRKGNDTV